MNTPFSKSIITASITAVMVIIFSVVSAQQISINQRSQLIMNGNVQLVMNNASFNNNGVFSASSSTVVFSGNNDTTTTYISGSNASTFNNLTVNKAAYGVALKAKSNVINTLTLNGGTLYTDSNLVLKSSAAITARVAPVATNSSIVGKSMVERYIPVKRSWRLMTAPVADANTIYSTWQNNGVYTPGIGAFITGPAANAEATNGLDVSPQSNTSMKIFNTATQQLNNVTNTKVSLSNNNSRSAANNAYFMFIRGDRNPVNLSTSNSNTTTLTAVGRLQVGDQTFNVSSAADAYTLVGNPYASGVDFKQVTKSNVVNRFYVWDPSLNQLGGYVMLDDLTNTGTWSKSVSASAASSNIQSGQAVFVQTIKAGAASVTFTESSKSTSTSNAGFRPSSPAGSSPSQFFRTNLYVVNADNSLMLADGIFAEFNDVFTDGITVEDALKFTNVNENLGFARNGTILAAERRPSINKYDTLYLKLWKTTQQNYQFEFIPTDLNASEIYLLDSYLGTSTPVNSFANSSVNFTIDADLASANQNRFKIVFRQAAVLPVTFSNVSAHQQNNNIQVEWKVENEINMSSYDVEKSADGIAFTKTTAVTVTGTSNANNNYNWLDTKTVTGTNFYRIKSYSTNGEVKYSAIVKVTLGNSKSSMSIYPNPVTNNIINLQLANQPKGTYHLRLTNSIGQVIHTATMQSASVNTTLLINVPGKLASGIYSLEVNDANNITTTQSVIVN